LLVLTDEPLAAIGLKVLFEPCNDIDLQGVVSSTSELVREVSSQQPDVILLAADNGIDIRLLTYLRSQLPASKIILWVYELNPEQAYQAIDCGVRGILRKSVSTAVIVRCLRKVHQGDLWIEKTFTDVFLKGQAIRISKRERELITLVTQGLKNKEIAEVMWITEGTVKVYLSRLFTKLRVKDRLELALFGLRNAQSDSSSTSPGGTFLVRGDESLRQGPKSEGFQSPDLMAMRARR
jgi:DNA-binding NarL/FixJ family response regulator